MTSNLDPSFPGIPSETYRTAREAFHSQHIYIRIGDGLAGLYPRFDWKSLDPAQRFDPITLYRLTLASAFQFAERLSDPFVSEASLLRLDWKYALALPLNHPGLAAPTLCIYRQALYSCPSGLNCFAEVLRELGKLGLSEDLKNPAIDAKAVLLANCMNTHLDQLSQAMRNALSALAGSAPDWMRANALPHWYERYQRPNDSAPGAPSSADEQQAAAIALGADIQRLLEALNGRAGERAETRYLASLWKRYYAVNESGIHWRLPECACTYLEAHNA
ncbi:MAG TPA: hypothetical protein VHO48_12710 [Anaerolineaceae bacterium]|nr:hypothetical protein [Anaerolineaceae bacterium]